MTTDLDVWDEIESSGVVLASQAESLVIKDQPSMQEAGLLRQGVKALIEEIKGTFGPLKRKQDEAKKAILDEERRRLAGPEYALKLINDKLTAWDTAQRRERAIADARAAQEAKERQAMLPPGAPPVVVPAVAVPQAKVDGLGFSTHYKHVILDLEALIAAVAAKKVAPTVLAPVAAVLDDLARSAGPGTKAAANPGDVHAMPGVPGVGIVAERRARG